MTPGLLVSGLAAAFLVTGSIAAQVPGPRQRRGLEEVIVTAQGRADRLQDGEPFAWALARGAYQLMAYKDEYEVARLYTDGRFQTAVFRDFERYAYLDAIARLTHTFSPDTLPRALEVAASPVQVRAATPAQRAAFVDYSIKALAHGCCARRLTSSSAPAAAVRSRCRAAHIICSSSAPNGPPNQCSHFLRVRIPAITRRMNRAYGTVATPECNVRGREAAATLEFLRSPPESA